jgi:hypothetical protein
MILLLALACGGNEPAKKTPSHTEQPADLPVVSGLDWGSVDEPAEPATHTRQLKRMTVAQVRDSMELITGGISWIDDRDSNWDVYAETLGVADYQLRVESDLSPSVMFQKFLDDAAGATCAGWLEMEDSPFHSIEDTSSTEQADVRNNIIGLRWKIQGKSRDSADPVIGDYETLFVKVHQRTDSTDTAWATVCVAMFTHPDFFMY